MSRSARSTPSSSRALFLRFHRGLRLALRSLWLAGAFRALIAASAPAVSFSPLRRLAPLTALLALAAAAAPAAAQAVSFSGPTNFPAGHGPVSVAAGDFNG